VKEMQAAFLGLLFFVAACRTLPTPQPPSRFVVRSAEELLEQLSSKTQSLHTLRGTLKLAVDGPQGELRSTSFLLAERPSKLYVEVKSAFQQVIAVLVTDGVFYELSRSGKGAIVPERGVVHSQLLWETTLVPLQPEQAVAILLGTPLLPKTFQILGAQGVEDGEIEVSIRPQDTQDQERLRFDAEGRLVEYQVFEGSKTRSLDVSYDDFRDLEGVSFPHRIRLEFPLTGTKVRILLHDVVLNPMLPEGIFDVEVSAVSRQDEGGP